MPYKTLRKYWWKRTTKKNEDRDSTQSWDDCHRFYDISGEEDGNLNGECWLTYLATSQPSSSTFSVITFYKTQDFPHYHPIPFFPSLFLTPKDPTIMPLKWTYASLNVTKPETNINQYQFLPLSRHHQYYLPGRDLYIQVENILFWVHSYFFTRESSEFRTLLQDNTDQPYNRSSLSYPLFLPNITPNTLAKILWVFYNPKLSIYKASYKDWTTILGFTVEWGFLEIEELALREFNTFPEHHKSHNLYHEIIDQLDDYHRAIHLDMMRAVHRHLEDDHSP